TLSVVGRTLLGSDTRHRADDVRVAIAEIQRKSDEQLNSLLRVLDLVLPLRKPIGFAIERGLPTASNRRFRRAVGVLDATVGDRAPTFKDLAGLSYTRRVWDEVLRLYPPFWRISRQAIADDVVAGFRIPAGCAVLLAPYLTQRHPGLWPDPDRFDPDRFLP